MPPTGHMSFLLELCFTTDSPLTSDLSEHEPTFMLFFTGEPEAGVKVS